MHFKYRTGEERVVIVHNGDTLLFSVIAYKKTDHMKLTDPYRDLNKWLAQQSPSRQQMIFDVYVETSTVFNDVANPEVMSVRLQGLVELLYNYINYESISEYVNRTPLAIPADVKPHHASNDTQPERTYIVSDYWELVKVALALRAAIPIFSRYMDVIAKVSGVQFKERETALLIQDTWIMSSPAIEKLQAFSEINAPSSLVPVTAVYGGLSRGEFPEWLLSMILVRRVAIGEIDSLLDKGSVAANVYQYVKSVVKGMNPRFGGPVGDSSKGQDYGSDENSIFMRSRVRQETPATDMVAVEVMLSNALLAARQVDPSFTIQHLAPFEQTKTHFKPGTISEFHVAICAWLFYLVIPPDLMFAIKQKNLLADTIIPTCRAILWKWGHRELSLLLSAPFVSPEMNDEVFSDFSTTRSRMPSDVADKIMSTVPYNRKKAKSARDANYGFVSVTTVKDLVPPGIWSVKVPKGHPSPEYVDMHGNMSTPPDIHGLLANLFLDIAKRGNENA